MSTQRQTFKCLGHNYINKNANIIICKEYFEHPEIFNNKYNNSRLCQWFMISKPFQAVFLDCYKESLKNIKEKYEMISELHSLVVGGPNVCGVKTGIKGGEDIYFQTNDVVRRTELFENRELYFVEVLKLTGPILFTKKINKILPNDEIIILPSDFFCCGSGVEVPLTKNSYVKHHYYSSWLK